MGKIHKALEKSGSAETPENAENVQEMETDTTDPAEEQLLSEKKPLEHTLPPAYDSIPQTVDRSLVTILAPESVESEQFRLLKNNILFPEKGIPPRSIMITSASPNEGKSFVAANLAVSIAKSIDEHVLLMDCDLRSPTIHKLFGFQSLKGLSEHLANGIPLSELLQKCSVDKLTLLPGGTVPDNPSELLSSEQMRRLIHEVKLRYSDRYIIIDTPPPYLTSEGNALARQMDGIIVVVKNGKTSKRDIENLINIYGREKILGVVYNFVEKKIGYGYGYYKYGYGK